MDRLLPDQSVSTESVELMQDLLLQTASVHPERAAIHAESKSWSYGQLQELTWKYVGALRESGLGTGDRVGLLMENGPDYVAAYFATFMAGGTAVPLDTKLQSPGLQAILTDCQVKRLVITPRQMEMMSKLEGGQSPLELVICPVPSAGAHKFKVLSLDCRPASAQIRVGATSPAVFNYTSGSSGRPKGVVMSHRAILANTRSIVSYLDLTPEDCMMQILPFSYCYGASLLHTHFMVGASLVIDNRFAYPGAILERLHETGCTGFAGVPSTYHTLAAKCDVARLRGTRLRYATQAGGKMQPELVDRVRSAIAPARFFVMYGQTEASSRLTFLEPELWPEKRGSVGRAIPGVSIKIATESGEGLPPGSVGEVWAQGENLMTGYWANQEETAATLVDGWLRTGDLGRMDGEGFLFIEGRIRGIIKSQGYRISPAEVEGVLVGHPAVNEAAVVGVPDLQHGELVAAVLSLKPGHRVSDTELLRHCRSLLPAHKVPRQIALVPEIPKSASGKVQKSALIDLFETSSTKPC